MACQLFRIVSAVVEVRMFLASGCDMLTPHVVAITAITSEPSGGRMHWWKI